MTNTDVLWVNIANAFLGIATLVCCIAVAWGVVVELAARARARASLRQPDTHAFAFPELGLTMADGGKKEDEPEEDEEW